jgi:hypothetical protein
MAGLAQIALASGPEFGDVKVLAQVPQPGFPEGIVHTFAPGDIPDGIAFGRSGVLYVTDATPVQTAHPVNNCQLN